MEKEKWGCGSGSGGAGAGAGLFVQVQFLRKVCCGDLLVLFCNVMAYIYIDRIPAELPLLT